MSEAKSCLLIDDDHDDQLLFSLAIKALEKPIQITYANSCISALKDMSSDQFQLPDFIFLDLNLPVLNGFDCLVRIKADAKLAQIPIIIFSTSSRESDVIKSKALGAIDFISKPFHVSDLVLKLREFF